MRYNRSESVAREISEIPRGRNRARDSQSEASEPFEKLYKDLTNTLKENFFGRIFELSQLKDVDRDKARRDPKVLEELGGYFMKQINEAYERRDTKRMEELRWKLAREIAYYKSIGIPFPPKRREIEKPRMEQFGGSVSGAFAERFYKNGEQLIAEVKKSNFFRTLGKNEKNRWDQISRNLHEEYNLFLESVRGRGSFEPSYHIKNLKAIFEIVQREYNAFMEQKERGGNAKPSDGWVSAPEKSQGGLFARVGKWFRNIFS